MLSIVLTDAGFKVCSTSSGGEAILTRESQVFDLKLIDIAMPDMDAFTLLEGLRADRRFAGIAAMSSSSTLPQRPERRGFQGGAER